MPTHVFQLVGGGIEQFPVGVELPEDWVEVNFPPVDLPNAEGNIWAPAGTSAEMYWVWFYLCEYGGGARTVTLGRDYGAGGALGAGEYWLNAYALGANNILDWKGPFQVRGDDQIRGLDGGAGGNVVSCHLRIVRKW